MHVTNTATFFSTPYGKLVAVEYLKFFDFGSETITQSLQKFLKAFHLSGETQERERILIPFSKRYQECNNPDYGSEGNEIYTLKPHANPNMFFSCNLFGHLKSEAFFNLKMFGISLQIDFG